MIANGADDGRLVATSFEARRDAVEVPLPRDLPAELAGGLQGAGIDRLYGHQNEALGAAGEGHVIVTSGTASGKSLSFNLPVLERLAIDPKARALYLYPTKALAQDQARKLSGLDLPYLRHGIYDGDTPREDRPALRRRSNLILTNPDMLNMAVLPHHRGWGDFLSNLEWVVVDEAHTYRGVFGSHVANVLRRLRRVCRLYRAEPRFLLASATIANPGELAERLVGEPAAVVDSDTAPRAGRRIVMWNPPLIEERTQSRRSPLSEGAELLADLVSEGMRTICFLDSRKGIELIQRFARMRLEDRGQADLAARISPYRAGYTPQQRREIETRLAAGDLLGVVTTNALELGIDIGELDASICVTFPGTVASLRQMWGRAGRRTEGLAIYIAGDDALDQFFCRHPDEFLERPVEAAILDHRNERIQTAHVLAAAYEAPLGGTASQPGGGDDEILGTGWRERADTLVAAGELRRYRVTLTTRDAQYMGKYEISAAELGEKIMSFRQAVANPAADPPPQARELYDIIVKPVEAELERAQAKTLLWVLDGPLRYLPLPALHDGSRYMIERYQQVMLTPVSYPRLSDEARNDWRGLGLGVSVERGTFPALPAVESELKQIIRQDDATAQPPTKAARRSASSPACGC